MTTPGLKLIIAGWLILFIVGILFFDTSEMSGLGTAAQILLFALFPIALGSYVIFAARRTRK